MQEPKREKVDYIRPSLPSFTGARKKSVAVRGGRRIPKTHKVFKREIFALPFTYQSSYQADDYNFVYKIPRGEIRRKMVLNGLSAKVALTKHQTANEICREISSLFKSCFTNKDFLDYSYLSNLPGTKLLTVPKVNNVFCWDGAAVLSLHRLTIYIAVSENHTLCKQLSFQSDESTVNENLSVNTVSFFLCFTKIASITRIRTFLSIIYSKIVFT